jgi:Na+-translocating ferredoxin:NAD+ oxidoreductase RnfD subunit
MARWAGWGAGPAGAGAAGGPSRLFLGGALVLAAVVAVVFASQARLAAAVVAGCGAVYFALRLFGGLGRRP